MMGLFDEHVLMLATGISAAGKSTIGEALAQRFARGVHVRGDVFRRMVVAGRANMTAEPSDEAVRQLRLRYRMAAMVADEYFAAGFSVVVQDVVLGPDLPRLVGAIRSRPLFVVVLVPDPDVVVQREAARAKTAYRDVDLGVHQLDEALRRETPRLGLWLDSSELTPEQTVDAIAARASEAAVP